MQPIQISAKNLISFQDTMDDDDDEVSSSHTAEKIQQSAVAESEQTVFNSKNFGRVACNKNEVSCNKNDRTTV